MIALFTDFGLAGPYTGQMKAVIAEMAPGASIIDLFADAPTGNPKASAYLLAAYAAWFPEKTVFLCVVDPGVGGARLPIVLEADGRLYVGPGNGLFELVRRRARHGANVRDRVEAGAAFGELPRARPLRPGRGDARPRRAAARPALRRQRAAPRRLAGRPCRDRLRRPLRQRDDGHEGGRPCRPTRGSSRPAACWSARALLAIERKARRSGTRIRTDWPKSPSIRAARIGRSALRSACRSRS